MTGSGGIFVSYRRDDAAPATGWLADMLVDRFGRARVFIDVDTIALGEEFPRRINSSLDTCEVLLAIIGPRWLDAVDENGQRRLDKPDDFVALEIGAALRRGIVVIPVLVDGTAMVDAADLPEALKDLATRQAVSLDRGSFPADAKVVIESVDRILATAELRRGRRVSDVAPARSSGESGDPIDGMQALLLARVQRRKRLWWGTYLLSYLFASGVASFVNRPGAEDAGVMALFGAGLAWCVWRLRAEIANQRLLVEQLPSTAEIEPVRGAISRRHVTQQALICLVVSLAFAVAVALSPSSGRPPTTGTGALPASTSEIGDGWHLRQLP
jgi:hypothetical protein